jgi:hypothetical protein
MTERGILQQTPAAESLSNDPKKVPEIPKPVVHPVKGGGGKLLVREPGRHTNLSVPGSEDLLCDFALRFVPALQPSETPPAAIAPSRMRAAREPVIVTIQPFQIFIANGDPELFRCKDNPLLHQRKDLFFHALAVGVRAHQQRPGLVTADFCFSRA